MEKKYLEIFDKYYEEFGEEFPLMQADGLEGAYEDAKVCLAKKVKASDLKPQYGSVEGKEY